MSLRTHLAADRPFNFKHLANEIKEDKLHVPEIEQYALATKNLSEAAEKLDKIDPIALA